LFGLVRWLYGVRPALLAALLLAVSAWHITISRFSFPTVFDPLFGLTGLWLLTVGLQEQRTKNKEQNSAAGRSLFFVLCSLFFAGVFLGLALQTYHTGRVVPVIAGILFLKLRIEKIKWRNWRSIFLILNSQFSILLLGFLLAAGPLLIYALNQQAAFNDRV